MNGEARYVVRIFEHAEENGLLEIIEEKLPGGDVLELIKKLLLVCDVSMAEGKTLHPGRFAATLQETGLLD